MKEVYLLEIKDSPVISLLVNESIDRSLEQHLIVYVCSLFRGDLGPPRLQFVKLSSVHRAACEIIYKNVVDLLEKLEWPLEKLVALATNGAASMIGVKQRLADRLCADVPTFINVHCIVHR